MEVLYRLNQSILGQMVGIGGQILVPDCNGDDGSRRDEGCDAGGEPLVGGGDVGADVGDVLVFDGDDEVDAGVGEGVQDFWVGVVDLDLVDESGLEELSHLLRRREVVSESAVVYADGGNRRKKP